MLRLTQNLSSNYSVSHVIAYSDSTSESHLRAPRVVHRLPRSREVGQGYPSSVLSTLRAFAAAIALVARTRPDLVLCNGPGTCLPVVAAAFLARVLGACGGKVVFVESFCRVRSLSLTGRLLYPIVDRFFVHWGELRKTYTRSELIGTFGTHKAP